MGDFVYGPDNSWYSASGVRAGPSLQPHLTNQFRTQNPIPNISPADLDFVRRNRAASSDLGQASAATPIPPEKSALGQILSFGQRAVNPLTTGISTFALTQSPTIAGVTAAATGVKDIYRGARAAGDYLGEISGAPFSYNPSNPLVANNSLMPRSLVQGALGAVPNPVQLQPAEQRQQQRPAPAAPVAPAPMKSIEVKTPEIDQGNAPVAPMQSGELAPVKIELPRFRSEQDELAPQAIELPQRMYGGRAAYRAGGKVGDIEPLIQALMNKAKMAKKVSNKATEPLLNERDDAIASALAVAQKAI
jgi:hypothetical protein